MDPLTRTSSISMIAMRSVRRSYGHRVSGGCTPKHDSTSQVLCGKEYATVLLARAGLCSPR